MRVVRVQDKEIRRRRKDLVDMIRMTREDADGRDTALRETHVLQSTLQREVSDFETDFKQRVEVCCCCLLPAAACCCCLLLPAAGCWLLLVVGCCWLLVAAGCWLLLL